MAAVNYFIATQSTLSATQTGWTEPTNACKILGSSLAPNTKYLVLARGFVGGDSAASLYELRVTTADDADIAANSEQLVEPINSDTYLEVYSFIGSYTTDASPADIFFQVKAVIGGSTYSDQLSLVLLDLDSLGADNYIEASSTSAGDLPSTASAWATLSTLEGDTEYLFLGCMRALIDSDFTSLTVNLQDGSTIKATTTREGEDLNECLCIGYAGAWTTASSPNNVAMYGSSENGTAADHAYSYLIALKASAFAKFQYSYSATGETVGAGTTTIETFSFTPSTSGPHLVLGQFGKTGSGNMAGQATVAGTSVLSGDIDTYVNGNYDGTDRPYQLNVGVPTISTTSDIDLDINVFGAVTTQHEFLAVLDLELAPPPVYETFDYWQASELPPLGVGYESKGFDYDWQAGELAPGFSSGMPPIFPGVFIDFGAESVNWIGGSPP